MIWACVNKRWWKRWILISAKFKWILTLIQIVQVHCTEKPRHEFIWFHSFFSCVHSLVTETAQDLGCCSFPRKVWRPGCSFKYSMPCLLRLLSQYHLFCLINVVKAEITGIPPGIIRNKSLFMQRKFSSKMCSYLSRKEVILASVSILRHWNSILFVKSIWRG